MSIVRFAPLLLSALCLSACAAAISGEAVGHYPAAADKLGGEPPLASLPPAAGRVVVVRRTSYVNGVGQEIVLEGPHAMVGENRITVQALTTSRTDARGQTGEELKFATPSDTAVAAEIERQLPGMAMTIAGAPERDADGSIGYAMGSKGRLSCIYAWQYLAQERPLSFFEGISDTGVLPISVRVRLCREQPLAVLIDELRGLRVTRPSAAIQPVPSVQAANGDALDAAVGFTPALASTRGVTASEPDAPRLTQRATRPHAVHRRSPTHVRIMPRAKPKMVEAPSSVLPRLPEPDDVRPTTAPQRSPANALPLPEATSDAFSKSL